MATKNVHQDFYSSGEVELVRANVETARALLRTLILAAAAVKEGAISFDDDPSTSRWGSVLCQVCKRLVMVRSALAESISAPSLDWVTPLVMAEALDAALWGGATGQRMRNLDSAEVMEAAQVIVDALDVLTVGLEAARVAEAA
jgi:hypothetical protein